MNNLSKYLQDNILICDGAMSTYYKLKSEKNVVPCELANIYDKEAILDIHTQYIQKGAKLIRTNTFAANLVAFDNDEKLLNRIIENAVSIAKEAMGNKDVFIGGSIGPIPEISGVDLLGEYKKVVDIFIANGVDVFVLETFNNLEYIPLVAEYIKNRSKDNFVLTEFSLTPSGITKKGIGVNYIIDNLSKNENIDAFGFNCGIGPMHMNSILKDKDFKGKYVSAMPNSGYPEIINGEVVYVNNPEYFSKSLAEVIKYGVKIVGGCCGTTPEHIEQLSKIVNLSTYKEKAAVKTTEVKKVIKEKQEDTKFKLLVELSPPFDTDVSKILNSAKHLKEGGVDFITISDSPMGRPRADSVIISSKIKRETGINVLPHICCRDRNAIALRSSIIGAYIEGIRNFLVVTGDPVMGEDRESTKSVFNLNSFSLIGAINQLNEDMFTEDRIKIGGAVNFNVLNKDDEFNRLLKKKEKGAEFFLTQPIFTEETINYIKNIKSKDFRLYAGIMPLVSYKNAQFIDNELPGIKIPENILCKFTPEMTRQEAEQTGVSVAVDIINKVKNYVDGVYIITPFNRHSMVLDIIRKIDVEKK